jgi:hypothetical protein
MNSSNVDIMLMLPHNSQFSTGGNLTCCSHFCVQKESRCRLGSLALFYGSGDSIELLCETRENFPYFVPLGFPNSVLFFLTYNCTRGLEYGQRQSMKVMIQKLHDQ